MGLYYDKYVELMTLLELLTHTPDQSYSAVGLRRFELMAIRNNFDPDDLFGCDLIGSIIDVCTEIAKLDREKIIAEAKEEIEVEVL